MAVDLSDPAEDPPELAPLPELPELSLDELLLLELEELDPEEPEEELLLGQVPSHVTMGSEASLCVRSEKTG